MFNLLVTGLPFASPRGSCVLGSDRVFGKTDAKIAEQYKPGDVLDQQAVLQLPTIFTNETSWDTSKPTMARVGTITRIRSGHNRYEVEYQLDTDVPPIPNSVLESLSAELDLHMPGRGFNEFQTNHWAIKDADLFQVLFRHGVGRSAKPTVFSLPHEPVDPNLVAVMMPFDARFDGVYACLQDAITAAGMTPKRADDIWVNDHVIQDVVSLISRAMVVVCDVTGRNPNVFYEMGIAHTLGRNVIILTQSDQDVPFDIRSIRYLPYLGNSQGLAALMSSVKERLETLKARGVN